MGIQETSICFYLFLLSFKDFNSGLGFLLKHFAEIPTLVENKDSRNCSEAEQIKYLISNIYG